MRGLRFAVLAAVALMCVACKDYDIPEPAASVAPIGGIHSIKVTGTRFEITLDDGRTLGQQELVGAIFTLNSRGQQYRLRIDGARNDPRDPAGETELYEVSAEDPDGGGWHTLCSPDPDGNSYAFPMPGTWTRDGRHLPSDTEFSITCTSGAEGKCVRFGYKPWEQLPDGTSLWDYHQTCTRMLRADYCGDGQPHTKNGTPIDLYDKVKIQADEPDTGMTFEAAWAAKGAVCVRHPRWAELAPFAALVEECPALKGHLGDSCGPDAPALIFNRSVAR